MKQGGLDPVAALGLLQRTSHDFLQVATADAVVHLGGKVLHAEAEALIGVLDEEVVENFIDRHRGGLSLLPAELRGGAWELEDR